MNYTAHGQSLTVLWNDGEEATFTMDGTAYTLQDNELRIIENR